MTLWKEIWVRVLYGKSNPLLNRRGDGRLKQHTIEQNTSTSFTLLYPSPLYLSSRSSFVLREGGQRSSRLQGRSGRLGAAHRPSVTPDGFHPGEAVRRVSKASAGLPAYRAAGQTSFDVSCGASPPMSRVHGDVFVCEHTFWRLRWESNL